MQDNKLNPTDLFKNKLDDALVDFAHQTGVHIKSIDIIYSDVSRIGNGCAFLKDRFEIHFKTAIK